MDPIAHRRATALTLAVLVAFAVEVLGGFGSSWIATLVSNLGQCVAPALASGACWVAAHRAPDPNLHRAWRFLGASAASWALGQVVWTFYELTGIAAPYPSFADVGYLVAVPLALLGVWSFVDRSTASTRLVSVVDGLIVSGSLLGVSWPFVLGPSWAAGGDRVLTFALSLAYPIGNLVVVSALLLVMMRVGRRRSPVPLGHIAVGLLVLVLADSVFVLTSLKGTEEAVSIADVAWTAGYLAIFLGALCFPIRHRADAAGRERHDTSLRQALLPFTVAMVALAVRVGLVVAGHHGDGFLTAVTVGTGSLLLVRHVMTTRENQHLTRSLEQKIGELTAREGQLSHQALHDPLTGLANRRLFGDRVEHALTRSRRTGDLTAVLFVDLDDFKTVNDSLGHAAGDQLLVAVGARLSGCVRPGDTVARLGGDEFGILLEEVEGADHPAEVSDRILEALQVPFPVAGRQVFTRASIGVATARVDGDRPAVEHLLADADVALYAAKAAGKATYRRFETAMRVDAVDRLELSQDLRRPSTLDELVCHYQPIVDLVSGRVVAVEALVRWDHPTRGLLAPGAFVELAEDTGTIGAIGLRVLECATAQAAAWWEQGSVAEDLELHVNLSGRQLADPGLVAQVRQVLTASGFPPQRLVLEVTESVAVEIGDQHLDRLLGLRDLGVRVAIDDFGTGYSSLNYLRSLPVDVLKIDRAFAESIDGSTDVVLLEAIVRLGHSLGIEVVAEGIEREEQAVALRRMGCRRAQGFLFHRPLAADAVAELVARTSSTPAVPTHPPRPARREHHRPAASPSTNPD